MGRIFRNIRRRRSVIGRGRRSVGRPWGTVNLPAAHGEPTSGQGRPAAPIVPVTPPGTMVAGRRPAAASAASQKSTNPPGLRRRPRGGGSRGRGFGGRPQVGAEGQQASPDDQAADDRPQEARGGGRVRGPWRAARWRKQGGSIADVPLSIALAGSHAKDALRRNHLRRSRGSHRRHHVNSGSPI